MQGELGEKSRATKAIQKGLPTCDAGVTQKAGYFRTKSLRRLLVFPFVCREVWDSCEVIGDRSRYRKLSNQGR